MSSENADASGTAASTTDCTPLNEMVTSSRQSTSLMFTLLPLVAPIGRLLFERGVTTATDWRRPRGAALRILSSSAAERRAGSDVLRSPVLSSFAHRASRASTKRKKSVFRSTHGRWITPCASLSMPVISPNMRTRTSEHAPPWLYARTVFVSSRSAFSAMDFIPY
jgi:hypothetical protein